MDEFSEESQKKIKILKTNFALFSKGNRPLFFSYFYDHLSIFYTRIIFLLKKNRKMVVIEVYGMDKKLKIEVFYLFQNILVHPCGVELKHCIS